MGEHYYTVLKALTQPEPEVVYIVEGSTGEYSDHREWAVCALFDEKKAKEKVEQLTQLYSLLENDKIDKDLEYYDEELQELQSYKNLTSEDKRFQLDYTGSHYRYYKVEIKGE